MGHSGRTLLRLVGHSCGTLLHVTLGHSRRTLWSDTVVLQVYKTSVSYETFSKGHTSSLQNERFARDFLKNSHLKSAKQAFRSRLPPKVTRQVCKTSVSYETSSKSRVKSPKRAFRMRLPPKVTHQVSKASVSYETSSKSQAGTPHRMSQRHSPPPQLATSRFLVSAPKIDVSTLLTHTKYTAPATNYDLRHTSQPHTSLRLPGKSHFHISKRALSTEPATKSDNNISCKLPPNLRHTTRLE